MRHEPISVAGKIKYVGPLQNGKYHGQGKIMSYRGDIIFEGEFYEGVYSGKGKLKNVYKVLEPESVALIPSDFMAKYLLIGCINYAKDFRGTKGALGIYYSQDSWI